MKRSPLCALALATSLGLVACGTSTVSSDEISTQAQSQFDQIAQKAGQKKFPKITCPDDLEAKKGEKTRCTAKGNDGTLGITVTIASIKDDKAQLNFKGDPAVKK